MKARRRQGPDGMPSGVELVVGSRASVSMVDRSLVGSTKAPLMNQDAIGQAAQAFSASSWGCRNPQGSPAEPSYSPATARFLSDHPTVQEHHPAGPREVLQPTLMQE